MHVRVRRSVEVYVEAAGVRHRVLDRARGSPRVRHRRPGVTSVSSDRRTWRMYYMHSCRQRVGMCCFLHQSCLPHPGTQPAAAAGATALARRGRHRDGIRGRRGCRRRHCSSSCREAPSIGHSRGSVATDELALATEAAYQQRNVDACRHNEEARLLFTILNTDLLKWCLATPCRPPTFWGGRPGLRCKELGRRLCFTPPS